jgi:phosphomannomutase/phosphoglucomutase
LLEVLSKQGVRLHDIWLTIPKVCNTPEIRVDTTDAAKFRIVEIVRDHFCRTHQVIDLDGARIKFPHGWALVRASNTQPALVIRYEADSEKELQRIRQIVEKALAKARRQVAG